MQMFGLHLILKTMKNQDCDQIPIWPPYNSNSFVYSNVILFERKRRLDVSSHLTDITDITFGFFNEVTINGGFSTNK